MFIAHIRKNDGVRQSVKEHIENVSQLCADFCKKISLKNTGKLIGLLHDMGKETEAFKVYIIYCSLNPEDKSRRGSVDHATSGAKFIYDTFFSSKDPYEKCAAQIIAMVVCSHHGGLIDCINLNLNDKFTSRMKPDKLKFNYDEALNNFFEECASREEIEKLFKQSVQEIKEIIIKIRTTYDNRQFGLFSAGVLEKFLFSCLIDADRYDTYRFMTEKESPETLKNIDIDKFWEELLVNFNKELDLLPKETKVDMLRSEISLSCKEFAVNKPGIYQLLVPTGGGKTLSSLRYALEHAKHYKKDRIFYIIPFTTIIDQNSKDIKAFLGREDIVLEHHSNLVIDNDDEDYKLLTERWDSPIILTTMVQFLNTLFKGGTQSIRRMHNFTNSIIIFDEIQAIPIKCINMFNFAVNFLSKICNATIILCSATQPLLSGTERPILLEENAQIIKGANDKFKDFKRTRVIPKIRAGGYSCQDLKDFVNEIIEEKQDKNETNSVLVILNTKKATKELFRAIDAENSLLPEENQALVFHLSTNMCPAHRMKILESIKEVLGKRKIICISTQLIEAGVNISFKCVVRSLAGLDSIAQAAGRCNRHAENDCGNVFIVNMDQDSENISKLLEIKAGQQTTNRILTEYDRNPEAFDNDLISPQAIKKYFQYYFDKLKSQMNYTLPKPNSDKTMFDLLSENREVVVSYVEKNLVKPDLVLHSSFKTAGDYFEAIDQNTRGVIVPYGKGEELIIKINGRCNLTDLKRYLKEAQQYSVNLYDLEFKKLEALGAIVSLNNGGVLALRKGFYDENTGVTEEKRHEFLNY
jgi:CRISPR-associated endonuclease/helicase Cas3